MFPDLFCVVWISEGKVISAAVCEECFAVAPTEFLKEGVCRNGHFLLLEANRNPIPSQTKLVGGGQIFCPKLKILSRLKILGLSEKR